MIDSSQQGIEGKLLEPASCLHPLRTLDSFGPKAVASVSVRNGGGVLICPSSPTRADRHESQGPQELVDRSLVENSSLLRKTHQELNSIYGLAGEEDLLGPLPAHPSRLSSGTGLTCICVWELEPDSGLREGMIFSGVCPWNSAQLGVRGGLSLPLLKDKRTFVSWTVAFSCD